jgi:hypothetical protein
MSRLIAKNSTFTINKSKKALKNIEIKYNKEYTGFRVFKNKKAFTRITIHTKNIPPPAVGHGHPSLNDQYEKKSFSTGVTFVINHNSIIVNSEAVRPRGKYNNARVK